MRRIHLRTLRESKGLTQEQLEVKARVTQSTISKLETNPNAKAEFTGVLRIAEALNVDPRALRFGPDPKSQDRISA